MNKINILGTEYVVKEKSENEDSRLKKAWGFCDHTTKEIVINEDVNKFSEDMYTNSVEWKNKVIRHEVIHAFLYESGLKGNSHDTYAWAENEEMVDWFAIQSPKIFEVYKKLGVIQSNEYLKLKKHKIKKRR